MTVISDSAQVADLSPVTSALFRAQANGQRSYPEEGIT